MVRPRQITDEEILDVARRMFFEHGPAVSTNAIAQELEISQAALFKRFGTKAVLIRRAMRISMTPPFVELLDAGPDPDRGVREQLEEVGLSINAFFEELAPAAAVLKMSGAPPDDLFSDGNEPPPVRAIRALTRWLATMHEDGRANVSNPEATAMSFLGALHIRPFLEHMFGAKPDFDGPSYVREVVESHWAAIAPQQ